jgi:hypothetical protein
MREELLMFPLLSSLNHTFRPMCMRGGHRCEQAGSCSPLRRRRRRRRRSLELI